MATTTALASTTVTVSSSPSRLVTSSRWGPTKRAVPRSFCSAGMRSTRLTSWPERRVRSARTRSRTAMGSTWTSPSTVTPKVGAWRMLSAAWAAAMRALEGMQPTRAHMVP